MPRVRGLEGKEENVQVVETLLPSVEAQAVAEATATDEPAI